MYEEASNSTMLMLLHTAVYPFIAALIVSLIAGKVLRASSYLGYLGGFLVGLSLIHSGLSFPPAQAIDYYSITTLIGIIGVLLLTTTMTPGRRYGVTFVLSGLSFYLLLNPVLKHSGLSISLSWAVVSAAIVLTHLFMTSKHEATSNDTQAKQILSPLIAPIGLMITAGSAAPVVSIGGSLLIGQLLGAFAAAMFAYVIVAFMTRSAQQYSSFPAALLLGGLITQSHVLADIPLSVMLIITAGSFVTPIAIQFSKLANNKHSILIMASQAIASLLISGFCLWLVWPESSLY